MTKARTFHFVPFSHVAATACIIPGSTLVARLYPARIEVFDYGDAQCLAIQTIELGQLEPLGPLEQFTVVQNLEKGYVQVSGFSLKGYIAYSLYAAKNTHALGIKVLKGALGIEQEQEPQVVQKRERLHLGCYKKQRFPDVLYRLEPAEFLPLLYFLAQSIPKVSGTLFTPQQSLLSELKEQVSHKEETLVAFQNIVRAGFTSLLLPRLVDTEYHGFGLPITTNPNQSPLLLLQELFPLIRMLFFNEEEGRLELLPHLSRKLPFGFLSCVSNKGHELSFEWSKHWLRTLRIKAACDDALSLHLPKECKRYRCSTDKKKQFVICQNYDTLSLKEGQEYLLDQVQG